MTLNLSGCYKSHISIFDDVSATFNNVTAFGQIKIVDFNNTIQIIQPSMFFGWMNTVNVQGCMSFVNYVTEYQGSFKQKSFKSYGLTDEQLSLFLSNVAVIGEYHVLNTNYTTLYENQSICVVVTNGMQLDQYQLLIQSPFLLWKQRHDMITSGTCKTLNNGSTYFICTLGE